MDVRLWSVFIGNLGRAMTTGGRSAVTGSAGWVPRGGSRGENGDAAWRDARAARAMIGRCT